MSNKAIVVLGSVGLLSLSISCEVYPQQALSSPLEDRTVAQVVNVTDGDTVKSCSAFKSNISVRVNPCSASILLATHI